MSAFALVRDEIFHKLLERSGVAIDWDDVRRAVCVQPLAPIILDDAEGVRRVVSGVLDLFYIVEVREKLRDAEFRVGANAVELSMERTLGEAGAALEMMELIDARQVNPVLRQTDPRSRLGA